MISTEVKRWLEWKPALMSDSAKGEPTKLPKPSSVSFVGSPSGQVSKIWPEETQEQIDSAMDHMNAIGARILPGPVLAIPAAAYDAETRLAIKVLDMGGLDVALLPEVAK